MTLTIGRVGLAAADGGDALLLDEPDTGALTGRALSLAGVYEDSSRTQLMWRGGQLLGLLNDDEPVVPVTSEQNPDLDGFYRLRDVSVDYRKVTEWGGHLDWAVELERLTDYRFPRIEYPTTYGLLVNSHSITSFTAVQGVSSDLADFYPAFVATGNSSLSVSDGAAVTLMNRTGVTTAASGIGRLVLPASRYYHAGARVSVNTEGSTWRQAVGRVSIAGGKVRIENGLVRYQVDLAALPVVGSSVLTLAMWQGAAWGSTTEFYVEGTSVHDELVLISATVLRNTPEAVTVRFAATPSSLGDGAVTVDITLRRALTVASVYVQSNVAAAWRMGFKASTPSTAITGGIRRTNADANGDRHFLVSKNAVTNDTANGRVSQSSAQTTSLFGLGVSSGTPTAAPEWFGALDERGIVVTL